MDRYIHMSIGLYRGLYADNRKWKLRYRIWALGLIKNLGKKPSTPESHEQREGPCLQFVKAPSL